MTDEQVVIGPRALARVFDAIHNVAYYTPEINAFKEAGMRGWWTLTSLTVPLLWTRLRLRW